MIIDRHREKDRQKQKKNERVDAHIHGQKKRERGTPLVFRKRNQNDAHYVREKELKYDVTNTIFKMKGTGSILSITPEGKIYSNTELEHLYTTGQLYLYRYLA